MLFRRGWQACRRRYEMLIEFPSDIRATCFKLPRKRRDGRGMEDYRRTDTLRYPFPVLVQKKKN